MLNTIHALFETPDMVAEGNFELTHNANFVLSKAKSRTDTKLQVKEPSLAGFIKVLATPHVSYLTRAEYDALTKSEQGDQKDVGGFVGGPLKDGRRSTRSVQNRTVLTLDADYIKQSDDFLDRLSERLQDVCFSVYSTRNHKPTKPRYRIVVYADRPMLLDEHNAVAQKICSDVGIEYFDRASFDAARLMYFPSVHKDAVDEFEFYHNDAPMLAVDSVLSSYGVDDFGDPKWKNLSSLPNATKQDQFNANRGSQRQNPQSIKGVVGAFNRAYPLEDAVAEFLSDVYEASQNVPGRYTFKQGEGKDGMRVYPHKDSLGVSVFAYSDHSTDPAHGALLSAFDLVRVHKFGAEDDEVGPDTPISKLPSTSRMKGFARDLDAVKAANIDVASDEALSEAFDEFESILSEGMVDDAGDEDTIDLTAQSLEVTDNGEIKPTFSNLSIIFDKDPYVKDLFRYNELTSQYEHTKRKDDNGNYAELDDVSDISYLRRYTAARYKAEFSKINVIDAVMDRAKKISYHPIKDYLVGLRGAWDGKERIETLFIDCFGAKDNVYVREAASTFIDAAVTRIFQPGKKYDMVPVLTGPQNLGKSLFGKMLAGGDQYFGELRTMELGKSLDETDGKWVIELDELAATTKHGIEQQKAFITTTAVKARRAYARFPQTFYRGYVMFGTSNDHSYLVDATGNRRFNPIDCYHPLDQSVLVERDQIWAEAMYRYDNDLCRFMLSAEAQALAAEAQEDKRESDPFEASIRMYLDASQPVARCEEDYSGFGDMGDGEVEQVDRICVKELADRALGLDPVQLKRMDSIRIGRIMNNQMRDSWDRSTTGRFGKYGINKCWVRKHVTPEDEGAIDF